MKIAVISDLHIKNRLFGNKFLVSDEKFAQQLHTLSSKFDMVILNGDVFELWKTELPFYSFQEVEFNKIRAEYPKTLAAMQKSNVALIMGNHDNRLKKLSKLFPELSKAVSELRFVNSKSEIFVFWHGHLDLFNRWIPYVGFFITWFGSLFERIFSRGTSDYKGVATWFKKPFFKNSTQKRNFRRRIRKNKNIVFVANGHTHDQELKRFNYKGKERIYLNTGYYNNSQPISVIDLESKEVELYYL